MNTCYYCGRKGDDVNKICMVHVGGKGEILFHCCDDTVACLVRVWENKEKGGAEE